MKTFTRSFAVPQLIGALAFSRCNPTAQLVDMFFLLILAAAVAGVHYMAGNRAQPYVFCEYFAKKNAILQARHGANSMKVIMHRDFTISH